MMHKKLTGAGLFEEFWRAMVMLGEGAVRHPEMMFTLIAIKRLSDRFTEETLSAVEFGLSPSDALTDRTAHSHMVPNSARWDTVMEAVAERPGLMRPTLSSVLDQAGDDLAQANPELDDCGLSGTGKVNWDNLHWWENDRDAEEALRKAILHLDRLDLSDRAVSAANARDQTVLGDAIARLVEKCQTNRKAGVLRSGLATRPDVAELMTALAPAREGLRVCDPAAGYGTVLTAAAQRLRRSNGQVRQVEFHAQDALPKSLASGKLLALLQGVSWQRWKADNALARPLLSTSTGLDEFAPDRFNVVYLHPPFVHKGWNKDIPVREQCQRFERYGVLPPENRGDMAWLLHALAITADNGRAVVALPAGALYRGGADEQIRRGLVTDDFVEAVIALPKAVFDEKWQACLVVLNRAKVAGRGGNVLFMDASSTEFHARAGRSKRPRLTDGAIRKIVDGFYGYVNESGFSRAVSAAEIAENGFSLVPLRYMDGSATEEWQRPEMDQVLRDIRDAERQRDEAVQRMNTLLEEMGYTVPD